MGERPPFWISGREVTVSDQWKEGHSSRSVEGRSQLQISEREVTVLDQ